MPVRVSRGLDEAQPVLERVFREQAVCAWQDVSDGLDGEEGLLNLVRRLSYERPPRPAKRARLSTHPVPALQVVCMPHQPNPFTLGIVPNLLPYQLCCLCGV